MSSKTIMGRNRTTWPNNDARQDIRTLRLNNCTANMQRGCICNSGTAQRPKLTTYELIQSIRMTLLFVLLNDHLNVPEIALLFRRDKSFNYLKTTESFVIRSTGPRTQMVKWTYPSRFGDLAAQKLCVFIVLEFVFRHNYLKSCYFKVSV